MLVFPVCKEHRWIRAICHKTHKWFWICENEYCDAVKPDGFYFEQNVEEDWIPFNQE